MQKKETYWNLIHKIGLLALALMTIGVAIFAFVPKVKQMKEYQQTYDSLQHRIEVTLKKEKELKNKQQRFLSDPVFVERIAHQVGYAKKDEVIFEFPKETSK